MAYNDVAEADVALGYVDAWADKDAAAQARELETAHLWLVSTFVGREGTPLDEYVASLEAVPARVKAAELVAVRHGLTVPLFAEPVAAGKGGQGAVVLERKKIEGLEKEVRYAQPSDTDAAQASGPSEIDALLRGIAIRRGSAPALPAVFCI